MLQRLALYTTLGLVLDAVELTLTDWGFWCILALFIASEWLTRREIIEQVNAELAILKQQSKQQGTNNDN